MADKLGILINAILNVKQEDLQKQLDSVAKKIKINLRPRIDFDENVIAKFKSDVDKLAKNIKLNLRFDVDKQSVKDAEKTVTETATKISEKSKSQNKIKIFDKEQLEAEGRQFFISATDIVNRVKNQFKDLGDVNVNFLKNAKNQIVGFEAEIKKLDGTIEKLRFNMAKIKVGDSTKEGFVFSGANLIDKNIGDVLQRNLNTLQKFETRLRNIRDSFTSSRGVKEANNLAILNKEYNSILSTIEKLRKSHSNLTEEQKRNIDKQINTLNSLYKAYRDIEITAEKGFNFKQFENITGQVIKLRENLNATVVTLKNYKDALSTPLLQGYRITGLSNVQETEEYLKLTQKLQKGNEFVDLTAYIDKATGSIYKYSHATRNAMIDTLTWSKAIQTAWKRMAQWFAGGALFFGIINQIKSGISYINELDNALNEIRIVTNKTQEEVTQLGLAYNRLAKEMKVSTKELSSTAADLFRQGLNEAEVEKRMKAIVKYAKISSISLAESNQIITATANATGESVEKIVDVFAMLGDITASGAEEIGEALQKVASTADNSGVSLEKAASWIATISSVTRESASAIGNSLKSIISRYEQIKEKGFNEEDATKINDVTRALIAVGIRAVDASGQLRPFTEVIDELGSKWDLLTRKEQAYVATALAGTYQRNRLISLLDNYKDSLKNYEAALNSAGIAEQKFAIYQESTQAALDRFRASWESLWQNTISSDFVKGIINLGTALLDITNKVGLLTTAFTGLVIYLQFFKKSMLITPIVNDLSTAFYNLALRLGMAEAGAQSLSVALGALSPYLIITGVYLLIKAFDALNVTITEYNEKVKESATIANSNISKIDDQINRYQQLSQKIKLSRQEKQELIAIERELKRRYGETTKELDLQNGSLEKNIQIMKQAQLEEAKRFLLVNKKAYEEAQELLYSKPYKYGNEEVFGLLEYVERFEKYVETLGKSNSKLLNTFVYNFESTLLQNYWRDIDNATEIIEQWNYFQDILNGTLEDTENQIKDLGNELKEHILTAEELATIYEKATDTIDDFQSSVKKLADIYKTLEADGKISADTILDLIQQYPQLAKEIVNINANKEVGLKLTQKLFELEKATAIANLTQNKAKLESQLAILEAQKEQIRLEKQLAFEVNDRHKVTQLSKLLKNFESNDDTYNQVKAIEEAIKYISKLTINDINIKTKDTKEKEIYEAEINQFQQLEDALSKVNDQIKRNEILTDLAKEEDKINLLSKRIDLYKEEQRILHQLAEARRSVIQQNVEKLQGLGFDISYDRNANELVIRNMEHLNQLKGKDAEATNKLRKETEELIKSTISLNEANREASIQWWQISKNISSTEDSIENLRKEQEKLREEQKKYAEDLIESYQNYVVKKIEEEIDAWEEAKKKARESAQEKIDAIQSEIDRLRERNEQLKIEEERQERLIEIAKQKEILENVKKQKNVRIYQNGQWVWVADPKKVKEETDKLKDLQEDYAKWEAENARQAEIQRLQNQIKQIQTDLETTENYYDNKIKLGQEFLKKYKKQWEEQKEEVTSYEALIQRLSGIEQSVYETRLQQLNDFVAAWNALVSSMMIPSALGGSVNVEVSSSTTSSVGSYADGGVVDYTGLAIVHGSPNAVETVFNAEQGKKLYDFVKNLPNNIMNFLNVRLPQLNIPLSKNNTTFQTTENHYHFENLNIQANDPSEMFRKLNMLIEQYT